MEDPLYSTPNAAYMPPPVAAAVHPPDLETEDASFATEVLPAPPPIASVSGQRRDTHLKRPSQVISYLPASDPGSTYSGLMGGLGLSIVPEDDGRLRKRPRIDKTAINNRAQRASARNLTPSAPPPPLSPLTPHPTPPDDPTATRPRDSKDKGKARDRPPPRIKEEPQPISLDALDHMRPPAPSTQAQLNDDNCSACRSHGALVYCDGCPRAFHLWCLDPPLDAQDIPEHRWFCPACVIRQNPPPRPRRSLLAPLLHQLQTSIPTEFELPDDIRGFFKDVVTGPKGAYQDSSETKTVRSSRFILQDEREAFRLKDRNGASVLCFRCGKSALPDPDPSVTTAPTRERRRTWRVPAGEVLWKSIVSCDHCSLHWHLDCLDPPLASMPPAHKKWMCPAHVEHIAPKRRVPRHAPPVTDVTELNRPNNGNIEIIPADNGADRARKMPVDEVHINGRRYRVPERVIVLDFWDKLARRRNPAAAHALLSGLNSPLTSLSSLEDEIPSTLPSNAEPDKVIPDPPALSGPDSETMRAVELLFGCRTAVVKNYSDRMDMDHPVPPAKSDIAVQTEPEGCVKLDVHNAKRLSGLISTTLHELDLPELPASSKIASRPPRVAKRPGRPPRPAGSSLPKPRHVSSRRLPSDTGSSRVTRSKAATTTAGASPLSPLRLKTEPSLVSPLAHTTRSASRTSRSTTSSTALPPPSPSNPTTHSSVPKPPAQPLKPATLPFKSEPSTSAAMSSPIPSKTMKSPFKIRIPRAINTAVAAATAAAAAASASATTSLSASVPRSPSPESSPPRQYSLLWGSEDPPAEFLAHRSGHSNGRRRPRTSTSLQTPSNTVPGASPARITRSSTTTTPRTPTRMPHDADIFDHSLPETDSSYEDSASDFVPPSAAKRFRARGGRRVVSVVGP